MKFRIKVKYQGDDDNKFWWEPEERDVKDPEEWGKNIINLFNETLREGERPRTFLGTEIIDATSVKDHTWRKTNLVTIIKSGRLYDTYQCEKCKITAKRFGLSPGFTRDPDSQAKVYNRCDTAIKHLINLNERRKKKEELDKKD
jgi:hypothetical protein